MRSTRSLGAALDALNSGTLVPLELEVPDWLQRTIPEQTPFDAILGLLPGIALATLLGDRVAASLRDPSAHHITVLGVLAMFVLFGGAWLQRMLRRRESRLGAPDR
jgi:hypothetical protein